MKIENGNYCVYVHTSPSGKMYVGQTGVGVEKRWGKNGAGYLVKNKKTGKYNQPAFAYAILKYGWNNFDHEIIADNLTKEEADNFEKLLIEKLETMNGKYGYNCKEGGSNGSISAYSRNKLSRSRKGKRTGIDNPNSIRVIQYSLLGEVVKIWDCMREASKELKINYCNIYRCCKYERKTAGGFVWRYYDDSNSKEYIGLSGENALGKRGRHATPIAQYSLSDELICVFNGISEAVFKTGVYRNGIYRCCKGERNKAGGFKWKYYDDIEEVI